MIKRLTLTLFFTVILSAFFSSYAGNNPVAAIEWEKTEFDFGKVPYEQAITIEFEFKNPGMMPLLINKVETSCGCTVADYPRQPIASGGKGKIKVTFDAKSTGYISKTISVFSNTQEGVTKLSIKGEVMKK